MRSQGDFSREVSAKQRAKEDYQNRVKAMRTRSRILSFFCNAAILAMVIVVAFGLFHYYTTMKSSSHTKVTTDMLEVAVKNFDKNEYSPSTRTAFIKNGKTYYNVTIGKYTTERSADEIEVLGSDTLCDTEIYTLNIKNTDPFFLSVTIPGEITIVRYSIFGEKPFTKKEIKEYKTLAAKYFTYQKYMRLNFPDADKYKVSIQGMAKKGDLMDVK
ncbi:MAG: hypothetical protein ACI4FX_03245 [Agathobacter sp.]